MTAATWWVAGLAAAVVLVPWLVIQIRRAWAAGGRRHRARLRAEALLWAWLSPAQRRQYQRRRWFEVTTASVVATGSCEVWFLYRGDLAGPGGR
jgi:hypothetical protein